MNALIMAGGSGSRFWPLSRFCRPKQFLRLWGEDTLLARTVKRLRQVTEGGAIYIVTGREYGEMTRANAPGVATSNLILEPFGRNTAACIGLASIKIRHDGRGDEVNVVCPADHLIGDEESFSRTLKEGEEAARRGRLVVIGVTPTEPNPHYGYIEEGEPLAEFPGLKAVRRFVEKPSRERASQMLEIGGYNWNAGIFLWTPDSILEAIQKYMPDLHEGLESIGRALGKDDEEKVIEDVYNSIQSIPIDIGILERSDRLAFIPARMDWCDVGNWSALRNVMDLDENDNVRFGKTVSHDSRRCLLWSSGRLVTAVGLEGIAVVETEDAILVCSLEKDQDLKQLLELLEREGYGECR